MPATAPTIAYTARQLNMLPGGRLDRRVALLKTLFPALAALTVVVITGMTLAPSDELSFVLARDRIQPATERIRAEGSVYRGLDAEGRPFSVRAAEAVQQSSSTPVIEMKELSASLRLPDGVASVTAPSGRMLLSGEEVVMDAPVRAAQSGYRVDGGQVTVDLKQNRAFSRAAVAGQIPLGTFRAAGMEADIAGRTITLTGGVHLNVPRGSGS